jgi:hypothetical protein
MPSNAKIATRVGSSVTFIPYNGPELRRRVRSKGFDEDTNDRRQVTRAARRLGPKDRKNAGGGVPTLLDRILSSFSELLSRVDRDLLSEESRIGQSRRGLVGRLLAIREHGERTRFVDRA